MSAEFDSGGFWFEQYAGVVVELDRARRELRLLQFLLQMVARDVEWLSRERFAALAGGPADGRRETGGGRWRG